MPRIQDLRKGITLKIDGELHSLIDFQHTKLGRGGSHIKMKLKSLRTGGVLERTFRESDEIEIVHIEEKAMQYLYKEGGVYYFMDMGTYEQISLPESIVGDASKFLKENQQVWVIFAEGNSIGIKLPNFCNLKVIETEPGVRGDTVSGGSKPAKLETGAVIQVPLFVAKEDVVKVDTRTGKYIERVKS